MDKANSGRRRIALVTGSSGNLGQAVVKKFIEEGYFVIGTVSPKDTLQINLPADKFEKAAIDLADENATQALVTSVIARYGRIDAAILTTGGFVMGNILETKSSDILGQYKLNFETAYNIARPVFLQMLEQNSGRIFLIGSKPGLEAKNNKGMVAYGLAKSLLFRLAELMNEEAIGKDVVTGVIVPGTIDTPQNRKSMPGADFKAWVKPEIIADIILWHCTAGANTLRESIIKIYNRG